MNASVEEIKTNRQPPPPPPARSNSQKKLPIASTTTTTTTTTTTAKETQEEAVVGAVPPAESMVAAAATAAALIFPKAATSAATPKRATAAEPASSSLTSPSSPGAATTPGGTRKRPYRRTKRPANYNDKSTVTTMTVVPGEEQEQSTAEKNGFDAVLQESEDLMQAAMEAQQLGRLKMASTYLLLLHARLVGLGKRFDKAQVEGGGGSDNNDMECNDENEDDVPNSPPRLRQTKNRSLPSSYLTPPPLAKRLRRKLGMSEEEGEEPAFETREETTAAAAPPPLESKDDEKEAAVTAMLPPDAAATATTNVEERLQGPVAAAVAAAEGEDETPKTAAAKQLASMLPGHIEMDQAMMEHLARAAVQLHAKRSGKAPPSSAASRIASSETSAPLPLRSKGHNNKKVGMVGSAANTNTNNPTTTASNRAVSFTVQEYQLLHAAAQQSKSPNIPELAEQTGRSEVQIKAFLRNLDTKNRLLQDLELLGDDDHADDDNNHNKQADHHHPKGGSSRKPVTAAMNTVPNAVCDARVLLQGDYLTGGLDGQGD